MQLVVVDSEGVALLLTEEGENVYWVINRISTTDPNVCT